MRARLGRELVRRRAAPHRVACSHVHPHCSHMCPCRAAPVRRRAARGWGAVRMRGGTRRVEVGCRAAVAPPAAAASRAWIHIITAWIHRVIAVARRAAAASGACMARQGSARVGESRGDGRVALRAAATGPHSVRPGAKRAERVERVERVALEVEALQDWERLERRQRGDPVGASEDYLETAAVLQRIK